MERQKLDQEKSEGRKKDEEEEDDYDDQDILVKLNDCFPELLIKKAIKLDQNIFLVDAQNQKYGVIILNSPLRNQKESKSYINSSILPKHSNILQIKATAQCQSTKEVIVITQPFDRKIQQYQIKNQIELMQMLLLMNQIVEGCMNLHNSDHKILRTLTYADIYMRSNIPKLFNLNFIKLEQSHYKQAKKVNFRQIMHKLGVLFLSLVNQKYIDYSLQQIQLEKQVNLIKNHDLMIMINEMIFNENQTQTPTFDDILIYLTRIKYKTMDFKDITMNINQVYSHYQDSSRYLTDSLRLPFLNSYQEIIEKSVQQQNAMALFLLAKMYALNQQQNKLSQQSLQKIKNLYLSAYQKGEKFSAFQLYLGEQSFDQNGERNEAVLMYLTEAIKRQDQRSYVQMERLRFNGSYGVKKQPQKALQNLQNSNIRAIKLFYNLVKMHLKQHNYEQAQKYISKCFAYGRNFRVLQCLYDFWLKQKKYLQAIECLKKQIKYLSKNQSNYNDKLNNAYYMIGDCYIQEGNDIQAIQWYQRCLSTQNKHKLRALIGLLFVDDKNKVNYLNQAITLENDQDNNLSIAYYNLGYYNSYYYNPAEQRQNIGKAIRYLQLSQSLGYEESSIVKGQLILRQTHDLNNMNLSIKILYESHKYCDQQLRQQTYQVFEDTIEDEDNVIEDEDEDD